MGKLTDEQKRNAREFFLQNELAPPYDRELEELATILAPESHVAHTAALVQALRHLTASTEYALKVGYKSEDCGDHCGNGCYWCELRSAVERAQLALDGQP